MTETNSHCFESKMSYFTKKVVIVGAGISGLACANRLRELGFQNISVLEAKSRVGGRIHGINFGSKFLEMGAQWIHGQVNNVIYEIAESKRLINTDAFNYMNAVKSLSNFSKNDREALIKLFDFLDDKMNNLPEDCCSGFSVLSYLNEQFKTFLAEFDSSSFDFVCEGYEWYCKFLLELNGCPNLSLLSLKMLNNYKECEGDPHMEIKGGYSSLLDILLNLISSDWILKNKSVTKIDWTDFKEENDEYRKAFESNSVKSPKNIKVLCDDGEIFLADHVVVTIPLGCLKRQHQSLFVPSLCKSKQRAIQSIGFGTVNKVYLQFQKPFWEDPAVFLVFRHQLHDKKTEDSSNCKVASECWIQSINRFSYTPGYPDILCAWIAGEGAVIMESLSEDEVISSCMAILENILNKKLPMPYRMLRSHWHSDPYACGSYSYLSVDCEKEGVSPLNIAEPEYANVPCVDHPVLMFAGEATHDCYFSTVHGAYETGVREAERLFRHYRNVSTGTIAKPWKSLPYKLGEMFSKKRCLRTELHVVIVGAGIAGLTCGLHLANHNFTKITILEAQDKIGGRVSTVDYNDSFLELGAQWIHGTNNALYDFSKIHKLLPHIQEITHEGKGLFCTSDGEVIDMTTVEEVEKIVNDAKNEISEGNYDTNIAKSVKTFLTEAFNSYINKCCDKSNVSLKRDLLNWHIKFEVIDNACDDLNDIAIQSFTEWDDCPEALYHVDFQKGFRSVLDAIISYIPSNIRLNTPVKMVKWVENFKYENCDFFNQNRLQNNFPILLECENKENIYADSVIVTASAGFLKENIDSFFSPSLPLNKVEAFKKIGFGTVNKIYLIYDKPFWTSKDLGFHFVWKSEGIGKCERLLIENPWIYGITGFDVMQKFPNVLLGWIGGEEARQMESIKEENVSNVCADLLRIFLNRSDIPDPIKILRSCWYSNPYIRGSYSNRTLKYYDDGTTLLDIQQPLYSTFFAKDKQIQWPIMLFSGEATDECSFSSAHGAFHSGLKAADHLIKTCSEIEIETEEKMCAL